MGTIIVDGANYEPRFSVKHATANDKTAKVTKIASITAGAMSSSLSDHLPLWDAMLKSLWMRERLSLLVPLTSFGVVGGRTSNLAAGRLSADLHHYVVTFGFAITSWGCNVGT